MPKVPPDLPALLPDPSPANRVQVQQTAFSHDVLGRYICNDWQEVQASIRDGAYPFDAIVIGAGMFGAYCAEKLYRLGTTLNLRVLLLDAGAFLFPTHIQNMPQRLGPNLAGPRYDRMREDGSGIQNVVWGMPWISNEPFPGLAYCPGGRSLFWGGWSPRLTSEDLNQWPAEVRTYLTGGPGVPETYKRIEQEIGVDPTTDYMMGAFHDTLLTAFKNARTANSVKNVLTDIEEAPLAVQGAPPAPGLFAFDKFSSGPFLLDAIRNDVAVNTASGDVSRRIFLLPRAQVLRLNAPAGTVSSISLRIDGQVQPPLPVSPACAVVLANGTIEATRLALESFGIGSMQFGSPRVGNLMGHLRSNITVRIKRTALGLPAGPPTELETTALLVRGKAHGRRFHLQVTAGAVGTADPEKNLFQMVPDVDLQDDMRANQDPDWIVFTLRGIGEMEDQRSLNPDPARSWIDLSNETDQGIRRAYVNLVATDNDWLLWTAMDKAAFDLAGELANGAANIQYWNKPANQWQNDRPQPDANGRGFWQDSLGSTHHEAGTLFLGAPGASITDVNGRFHNITNAYVAGPAVFPTLGSANPSLTGLAMARRTASRIVQVASPAPAQGFTDLSLAAVDWQMVAAPNTQPAMRRYGKVWETSGGYGLYWHIKQQFTNFLLRVEWRVAHPEDNSGVYIRIPAPNVPNPLQEADAKGHEVQIDEVGAGVPRGAGIYRTGAIYGLQGPTAAVSNPIGTWNTYLIEANGPVIKVTLNGQPVNTYQSNRQLSGYIALQAHSLGSRVQFRNLQIQQLP